MGLAAYDAASVVDADSDISVDVRWKFLGLRPPLVAKPSNDQKSQHESANYHTYLQPLNDRSRTGFRHIKYIANHKPFITEG